MPAVTTTTGRSCASAPSSGVCSRAGSAGSVSQQALHQHDGAEPHQQPAQQPRHIAGAHAQRGADGIVARHPQPERRDGDEHQPRQHILAPEHAQERTWRRWRIVGRHGHLNASLPARRRHRISPALVAGAATAARRAYAMAPAIAGKRTHSVSIFTALVIVFQALDLVREPGARVVERLRRRDDEALLGQRRPWRPPSVNAATAARCSGFEHRARRRRRREHAVPGDGADVGEADLFHGRHVRIVRQPRRG